MSHLHQGFIDALNQIEHDQSLIGMKYFKEFEDEFEELVALGGTMIENMKILETERRSVALHPSIGDLYANLIDAAQSYQQLFLHADKRPTPLCPFIVRLCPSLVHLCPCLGNSDSYLANFTQQWLIRARVISAIFMASAIIIDVKGDKIGATSRRFDRCARILKSKHHLTTAKSRVEPAVISEFIEALKHVIAAFKQKKDTTRIGQVTMLENKLGVVTKLISSNLPSDVHQTENINSLLQDLEDAALLVIQQRADVELEKLDQLAVNLDKERENQIFGFQKIEEVMIASQFGEELLRLRAECDQAHSRTAAKLSTSRTRWSAIAATWSYFMRAECTGSEVDTIAPADVLESSLEETVNHSQETEPVTPLFYSDPSPASVPPEDSSSTILSSPVLDRRTLDTHTPGLGEGAGTGVGSDFFYMELSSASSRVLGGDDTHTTHPPSDISSVSSENLFALGKEDAVSGDSSTSSILVDSKQHATESFIARNCRPHDDHTESSGTHDGHTDTSIYSSFSSTPSSFMESASRDGNDDKNTMDYHSSVGANMGMSGGYAQVPVLEQQPLVEPCI